MVISNNVTRMLKAREIEFTLHELPKEKLSALEAADFIGIPANQVFKTIVILDPSNSRSVLALVPGDKQVDLKSLGRFLGSKKMQTASQAQAEALTGLQTGGISALSLIGKKFRVILDDSAFNYELITISGGERGINISMKPQDLLHICAAKVFSISK